MSFDLAARLAARRAENLYRQRPLLESPQGPEVVVDGQPLLAFCNNDYLGLANHPQVIEAWRAGADTLGRRRWRFAPGDRPQQPASRVGRSAGRPDRAPARVAVHHRLHGQPRRGHRAGGAGRHGAGRPSQSRLAAGCRAACPVRVSTATCTTTPASLAKRLEKATGNTLVVTDGVFSMDGDLADLPALAREAKAKGAWLMVDDAHGFGPLGANGGGIVEHFGLSQDDVPVLVGTLGKAFGTAGAFVAGSEELIESLIQFARPYIYTTSQPPALACATLKSLELLRSEHWRREHLKTLIRQFRQGAEQIGLELMDSFTPIQPIMIGDAGRAVRLSQMLRERGLMVTAIRPPTVPAGSARLRVTLTAAHSEAQVQLLLNGLADCFPQLGRGAKPCVIV